MRQPITEDSSPGSSLTPTDDSIQRTDTFSYDCSETQSLGVSIIRAIASVADVDPLSLQPRLYDVIDSDALETLFRSNSASSGLQVTFQFDSYEVTVKQSGSIIIRDDTPAN